MQSEIISPDPPLPEPQRLVTKDTVDENVYEIAKRKLNLDAAVLKFGVEAENEGEQIGESSHVDVGGSMRMIVAY
ncbi:hypothetical protein OROMI_031897 [Orobanche minor]